MFSMVISNKYLFSHELNEMTTFNNFIIYRVDIKTFKYFLVKGINV